MRMTKTVWVLMGNDFPAGVFDDEERARAELEYRKDFDAELVRKRSQDKVGYWRLTPFTLNYGMAPRD